MVPRYGELQRMDTDGHRFLVAEDGLYIEARRPWVSAILPAGDSHIRLPYGVATPQVSFSLRGIIPLLHRFIVAAGAAAPDEHAAWLSSDADGNLMYEEVGISLMSASAISYQRPKYANMNGRVLAVDCHSHGHLPAFFSDEDNRDALDDIKLEVVVGNLDDPVHSIACRLSILGMFVDYSEWLKALVYDDS